MKAYVALIISFVTAEFASFLIFFKHGAMHLDESYAESLHLSPDADSIGIPIFGAALLGIFVASGIVAVYLPLAATLAYKGSANRIISWKAALLSRKSDALNIPKIIAALFTVTWLILLYFPGLYTYVNPFYILPDVVSAVLGVVSLVTFCMVVDGLGEAGRRRT